MAVPYFIFTKFHNSFSVHVKNLEELSVEQIQNIEFFVRARKGLFDFSSYTFVLQKKLEFGEFVLLIKKSSINAVCEEKISNIEQKDIVEFGKYKGMRYSELPDSYLLWLKSNYMGKDRVIIDAEIKFREL